MIVVDVGSMGWSAAVHTLAALGLSVLGLERSGAAHDLSWAVRGRPRPVLRVARQMTHRDQLLIRLRRKQSFLRELSERFPHRRRLTGRWW